MIPNIAIQLLTPDIVFARITSSPGVGVDAGILGVCDLEQVRHIIRDAV